MVNVGLGPVDYTILIIYTVFVLGIGFALKRFMKSSTDFFLSGRSIPAWITGLAFISANLGAQEVIGMGASGAKYGLMTSHFYWLGAIPAMVFVGIFMMPFYYGSRARSVPEYLKLRFDEKTRGFNAISFAVMTVFSSGVSMYALAKLMNLLLGWNFDFSLIASAIIVLVYIFLGGLTSAIYNEVLQFFLIVLGFLPLVFLGLKDVGGWNGLVAKLNTVAVDQHFAAGTWTDSWKHLGSTSDNPMGVEWFGLAMGLGFVLSFGYWCTDFLVVQRAMAANSDVRRTTHAAHRRDSRRCSFPVHRDPAGHDRPGGGAARQRSRYEGRRRPPPPSFDCGAGACHAALPTFARRTSTRAKALFRRRSTRPTQKPKLDKDGKIVLDYDLTMPMMLINYFPNGLLGLGLVAADGLIHVRAWPATSPRSIPSGPTTFTRATSRPRTRPTITTCGWAGSPTVVGHCPQSVAAAYMATQVQQHHGRPPARLRLRERAAVRDLPAGHVLAACDRARGVFRAPLGHSGGRHPSRPDRSGRGDDLDEGRLAGP